MVAAIQVQQPGGPETLAIGEVGVGAPGPGEIRIRQHVIGVNYVDAYFRSGLYPSPVGLPFVPGNEAAGEVTAVGANVSDFKIGDRVTYLITFGAYAAERVLPAHRSIRIPDAISYEQAGGMMLKGMTVRYLLRRTFKVERGTTVLIHAAAGGVGLIACQWAAHLGATVIGTVGSKDKAELARANGCHHTILYRDEDFVARVREITDGQLCDVVYDGVGKTTYPGSLDCLRPLGLFVNYGNASGQIEAFDINLLGRKGSLFATRTSTAHYLGKREELLAAAADLFAVVESGAVKIPVHQRYALKDAAKAHRDLEGRQTTGSSVLIP
jgi:NADPH2:quinone reductase